jgi:hypothetical protein
MYRKSFLLVLLVAALSAVPTALGVAPIRTVTEPEEPILIPAGTGCAFDVLEELGENARITFTEFSDGRLRAQAHGDVVLRNLETEQSSDWKNRWNAWQTSTVFEASGRLLFSFFPGDQGPFGTVGENGALFGLVGHTEITFDADTGAITSFSLDGQAIDICPLLTS